MLVIAVLLLVAVTRWSFNFLGQLTRDHKEERTAWLTHQQNETRMLQEHTDISKNMYHSLEGGLEVQARQSEVLAGIAEMLRRMNGRG